MLIIILIIIIITGIIGNLINVNIFIQKDMRKISIFRLLLYLSVIDLLVLFICTGDTVLTFCFKIHIRLYSTFTCKMHTFLTYYLTHMSSIVLMCVSVQRYLIIHNIEVFNSIKVKFLKQKFKLYHIEKIIFLIAVLLAILNSHYLIFFDLNEVEQNLYDFLNDVNGSVNSMDLNVISETLTTTSEETNSPLLVPSTNRTGLFICYSLKYMDYTYFLIHNWLWIDTSIYFFLPNTIMIVCSIMIFIEIKRKSKGFLKTSAKMNRLIIRNRIKRNKKIFYMLLGTNIFFCICSIPYCVWSYNAYDDTNTDVLLVVYLFSYSNNSFNFLFYLSFSNLYREAFVNLFRCKKTTDETTTVAICSKNTKYGEDVRFLDEHDAPVLHK